MARHQKRGIAEPACRLPALPAGRQAVGRAGRLFKAFDNEAIGQKGLWSFMSFYIYSAISQTYQELA